MSPDGRHIDRKPDQGKRRETNFDETVVMKNSDAFNNSLVPGTAMLLSSKEVESPLLGDKVDRNLLP